MDKQTVVQLYSWILLSNKKEQTIKTSNNLDESQRYAKWRSKSQKACLHCTPQSQKDKTVTIQNLPGIRDGGKGIVIKRYQYRKFLGCLNCSVSQFWQRLHLNLYMD